MNALPGAYRFFASPRRHAIWPPRRSPSQWGTYLDLARDTFPRWKVINKEGGTSERDRVRLAQDPAMTL